MCAKESYEVFLVGEVLQPAKPHNFLGHNWEDGGEETVEGDAAGGDGDWQVGCQGYLQGREENNKSPEKLWRYAPTKGNYGKKDMKEIKEKKDKKEKKNNKENSGIVVPWRGLSENHKNLLPASCRPVLAPHSYKRAPVGANKTLMR